MTDPEPQTARLVLPASGATEARVRVVHRPQRQRVVRAALVLAVAAVVAPVVFFVPPHVLWPPVVLIAGLVLAWREWRGEYTVESFEGRCPRCGYSLTLDPGSRIRGRQRLECYGCHREPELILGEDNE